MNRLDRGTEPAWLPLSQRQGLFLLGLTLTGTFCVWLLHPLGAGATRIQGNVDTYLHAWNLWWVYRALIVEGTHPYFTTFSGYPHGAPLYYHSMILPLGLVSLPLFGLGLSASVVYLVWLYVFPLVGYAGMFYLVDRLRGSPLGAMASGLYFVLMPFYWNHLSHPDRFCLFLLPWVILTILQLADRPASWVLVPSLLASFLFLMSPYYAAGLGVLWFMGLFLLPRLKVPFGAYLWVGPLTLLLTAFEWLPRLLAPLPVAPPEGRFEVQFAGLPANLGMRMFFPHERMIWIQPIREWFPYLNTTAGTFYLGFFALGILAYTVRDRWNARVRWCVLVTCTFLVLPILPDLIARVSAGVGSGNGLLLPGRVGVLLGLFRSPTRLLYFMVFFVALGLGFFHGWRTRYGAVVLVLVLVELIPMPVWNVRTLPPREGLRQVRERAPTEAVVPFPFSKGGNEAHYGQTVHHLKFPVGPATYLAPDHRRFLLSNPVLKALYRKEPPPEEGWRALRRMGYGGFLLHSFPRRERAELPFSPPIYQGLRGWSDVRDEWRQALRRRYGEARIRNDFFEFYRFDPVGDEME